MYYVGVRRLYQEDSFAIVTSTFCLLLNSLPQIAPADEAIARRFHAWDMRCTFVEEGDPRLDAREPNVHPVNVNISRSLRQDEGLHNALFHILVDAYDKPAPSLEGIKCANAEELNERIEAAMLTLQPVTNGRTLTVDAITKLFEFPSDKKNFLLLPEIRDHIISHGYNFEISIFKTLRLFGAESSGENKRTRNKQRKPYMTGIRMKTVQYGESS